MEWVERIALEDDGERWLARTNGEAHVAMILRGESDWLAKTETETRKFHGAIHPRLTAIHGSFWHHHELVLTCEDDRGPYFWKAARELLDPVERERWAVAQIIGIADGLATLRHQRDRDFVHRRLELDKLYIDVAGHLRLRAPIPFVLQGPRPGRMGAGVIRGSFHFMSPEQAKGMAITPATDVWALAAHLYYALSGTRPFTRENDFEMLNAIIKDEPAPLDLHTPGLAEVLARAFHKSEALRTPDPGTFAGELWQVVPDAIDYDECVSDKIVSWRANQPIVRSEPMFGDRCRMKWDQLSATGRDDVRHCDSCKTDVVHVNRLSAMVPLVGRCIAYTGGD